MNKLTLAKILFFVTLSSLSAFSQGYFENDESSIPIEDYWSEELTPISELDEMVRYIHTDPLNYIFAREIPAGTPLERELEVNSFYGVRKHPVHQVVKMHRGIDLAGKTGEFVISSGNGTVEAVGFEANLGNFVKIKHCYGFESIYGHLSKILVKKGQVLDKNTRVGQVGATGKVTGPHLHYTLKKNGEIIDPFDFLFMNFHKN